MIWKTKTFWVGVGLVISGIGKGIGAGDWNDGVNDILTGLGFIFLRQAIEK